MAFYLLLDTATNRIIRFSEEPLQAVENNTYIGQVLEIPTKMDEKNSWEFRFFGGAIKHAPDPKVNVVGSAAVLRNAKYDLRKTIIDKAQREFHRKVPLNALAYIATLDAARKWSAGQTLEPVELGFISSKEKADDFLKVHYANLERALKFYGPMSLKLEAIDKAVDAAELEKIVP